MMQTLDTHSPSSERTDTRLRGRDIVCLSHDWTGDPLSRTHVMRLLARENRVLWVNSLGYRSPTVSKADISRAARKLLAASKPIHEPERNIFVLNPLIIPVHSRPWIRAFNQRFLAFQVRRAMRRLRFQRVINWTSNPVAAVVAGKLDEELVVYHCVDENSAFTGVAADALLDLERQLMTRSDAVFVSAERLYEAKARHNPHTYLVRHGVDFDHFRRALDADTPIPDEVAGLPRPVIGFFGLIADWVDVDMMAEMARRFSKGSLVVIGKATTDVSALEKLPNVHLLGRKPYADLPAYCKSFDVALIPFRINELTLNANPLKVREYLAAGLPVVSSPIPEVEVLGQCRIARDADAFECAIRAALDDPGPSAARSDAVRHESWQAKIGEIEAHLAGLSAWEGEET
ncbi:MAG TPA: glycosyltransferase [Pirellulales bacterium]|nr:glycosyltransferase [Pirellulales bacterium]